MIKLRTGVSVETQYWHLRRMTDQDIESVHVLNCVPEVYRYLSDGVPPLRWRSKISVELNNKRKASKGLGSWVLEDSEGRIKGCVILREYQLPRTAELSYLLHPQLWGQGLATRMSWTVIDYVFKTKLVDQVVAGADKPNRASIAVMQRLGMAFYRTTEYPLGPGVEYLLSHDDPKPIPLPNPIPIADAEDMSNNG